MSQISRHVAIEALREASILFANRVDELLKRLATHDLDFTNDWDRQVFFIGLDDVEEAATKHSKVLIGLLRQLENCADRLDQFTFCGTRCQCVAANIRLAIEPLFDEGILKAFQNFTTSPTISDETLTSFEIISLGDIVRLPGSIQSQRLDAAVEALTAIEFDVDGVIKRINEEIDLLSGPAVAQTTPDPLLGRAPATGPKAQPDANDGQRSFAGNQSPTLTTQQRDVLEILDNVKLKISEIVDILKQDGKVLSRDTVTRILDDLKVEGLVAREGKRGPWFQTPRPDDKCVG